MSTPVRVRVRPTPTAPSPTSTPARACIDPRSRQLEIRYLPIASLTRAPRALRRRGRGQVEQIAANIARFGLVLPLPVTAAGELIDGHAVHEALLGLGFERVPVTVADHLSPDEVRALRLSLNKLAELSAWDPDALAAEFSHLLAVDPELIAYTGFSMPEVDFALALPTSEAGEPHAEEPSPGPVVSRPGDLWLLAGGHRLLCANARDGASYAMLLGPERVQMVFTDPPYGCAIAGHVSRSHNEFVEGSGLSEAEALAFFEGFLGPMVEHLQEGAIVDLCIDWRGMFPLVAAARQVGLVQQNLCVWDKGAGGMGSLYRSQAEFVLVMKWGRGPHINNVELGKHGRNRTTVWQAPGLAQFGRGRKEALSLHPTVKPVGLVADALLDTSHPNGIVLDPFCGSGTTLIAAHRTRRLGRGIELDPAYVDVAVRRMEAITGEPARHAASGRTFAEMASERAVSARTEHLDESADASGAALA